MRRAVARRIVETGGLSLARSGERHPPALAVTVPPYNSCRSRWCDYTAESCTPGRGCSLYTSASALHGACMSMFFRHSLRKAECGVGTSWQFWHSSWLEVARNNCRISFRTIRRHPNDFDRASRMASERFRHASKQEASQSFATVRTDYDQIAAPVRSFIKDDRFRIAGRH
jgi:hypothetical protein